MSLSFAQLLRHLSKQGCLLLSWGEVFTFRGSLPCERDFSNNSCTINTGLKRTGQFFSLCTDPLLCPETGVLDRVPLKNSRHNPVRKGFQFCTFCTFPATALSVGKWRWVRVTAGGEGLGQSVTVRGWGKGGREQRPPIPQSSVRAELPQRIPQHIPQPAQSCCHGGHFSSYFK